MILADYKEKNRKCKEGEKEWVLMMNGDNSSP